MAKLSHMMSNCGLEEKENVRHSTDRFIPLRKHSSTEASSAFPLPPRQEKISLRGQEVQEHKLTLDEVYRSVLLDNNTSKLLSFGSIKEDRLGK
jgi:hypothetical protein